MNTGDQHEVLAWLGNPATHGNPPGGIERIDTHGAVVFLAGGRALKLKRAIRFDYLDFSTRERRREACEAEVRLNRRTAPRLYLGVRAVARSRDGRLGFDGPGDPVDWVVEMRRFDQAALFDRLADRGALDPGLMPPLADAIAAMHRAAEVRADHGGAAGMAWVVEGNAAGLAEHGQGMLDAAAAARLTRAAREELFARAPLLDARRLGGAVRWCHGDLHLRNIVLLDGRPTIFDAVEFNERIACVDVLYDLAFLLMDLWRRALRQHANLVFNAYLSLTDDLEGLRLLPLFLSCRAGVRAKTSATAARLQPERSAAEALEKAAGEYLDLASRLLEAAPPRLVAIGGPSGTGKSTLAAMLAPALGSVPGAIVLRSDLIRKSRLGAAAATRLGPEGYSAEVTDSVYREIAGRAARALQAGRSVIADATYLDSEHRAVVAGVARRAGASFSGFWLEAPPALLRKRIQNRTGDASDATGGILEAQLGRDTGPLDWTRLDVTDEPNRIRQRMERSLRRG